jgi:serine/threonine-protein kinase HipA
MKRTIKVCLGDSARVIGLLRYEAQGAREHVAFEYDASWLADAFEHGERKAAQKGK